MTRGGFEPVVLGDLDSRGVKYEYEAIKLPYTVVRTYLPDLLLDNGVIVEIKGWFKPSDRSKMRAVKKQHPDLDIRFLFQRDNTLSKKSKTTYTEWCKRHGFPCAVGRIPDDWTTKRKRGKPRSTRRRTRGSAS